jgi:glycosyltransferase involved in cell wall biosynthesis
MHEGDGMLSILIPAYRAEARIADVVARALAADTERLGFRKQVIVCDDGSEDRTHEIASAIADSRVRAIRHDAHRGMGAAVRTALDAATGEWSVIHDLELDCDPADLPVLLAAAKQGAEVVYGSRFLSDPRPPGMGTASYVANRVLSITANLLYGMSITDEATCLKLFRTELLKSLEPDSVGLGLAAELTAKLGQRKIKIVEVPIAYASHADAKLRWRDGIAAMWILVKNRTRR